jgi:hypothetical protein
MYLFLEVGYSFTPNQESNYSGGALKDSDAQEKVGTTQT